jgi:hypothetical protein
VLISSLGSQWCKRVSKISKSREHLLVLELAKSRVFQLLPGSRRGNPRPLSATQ